MKKTKNKQTQKKHSDCRFFRRINPDAEGFDIFLDVSKIRTNIAQSNEKKTRQQIGKTVTKLHMQHF